MQNLFVVFPSVALQQQVVVVNRGLQNLVYVILEAGRIVKVNIPHKPHHYHHYMQGYC